MVYLDHHWRIFIFSEIGLISGIRGGNIDIMEYLYQQGHYCFYVPHFVVRNGCSSEMLNWLLSHGFRIGEGECLATYYFHNDLVISLREEVYHIASIINNEEIK